jgi:methionyl-tRNA formyltransferase
VAPKVSVDEARIRWDLPAHVIERRIRAMTPNPGAWTMIGDMRIKVGPVSVEESGDTAEPGVVMAERTRVLVGTGSVPIQLGQIQPPGKKPMAAADWARGARLDAAVRAS